MASLFIKLRRVPYGPQNGLFVCQTDISSFEMRQTAIKNPTQKVGFLNKHFITL